MVDDVDFDVLSQLIDEQVALVAERARLADPGLGLDDLPVQGRDLIEQFVDFVKFFLDRNPGDFFTLQIPQKNTKLSGWHKGSMVIDKQKLSGRAARSVLGHGMGKVEPFLGEP